MIKDRISQAEYGCEEFAAKIAYEGARLAREVADEIMEGTDSCPSEDRYEVREE